ncbi:MAG: tetratricopeptide repeat protein [Bacteroidaceae bacterium]|nr:tetratricopeptide repeat protein [Bacteroidaceae bacterium]
MNEDDWKYFHDPEFQALLTQYEDACDDGREPYMDADELTDIAEYYMVIHEDEKASQAISLARKLHPESVDPQVFLVRQQMFQGNMDEAYRLFEDIPDKEDQEVRFLQAELLLREQRGKEASRLLDETYNGISEDRAGFLQDAIGLFLDYAQWEEGKVWADRLRREFPGNARGRYLMADVLFSMGENAKAADELNQLLDRDPYNADAWNMLAEIQVAQEQYRDAIESTEYVLAVQDNNRQAMLTKANCLCHLNEMSQAHELYQRILQESGPDDVVYYYDALSLINMERLEEASEALKRANEVGHEMSQEQVHIYLQQSYVESKLHHVKEAIEALDKATAIANDEISFESELVLGQIYLENGRMKDAQKHFEKALDASEDKQNTMMLIGIAYGEAEYYAECAKILQTLLRLYGHDEARAVIPYLAFCYYNMDDPENYLHYLKEAPSVSRETTAHLFNAIFPNIAPEDYYFYAFKDIYGRFPEEGE